MQSSLSQQIFIEVPVPSQECERSCISVLSISTFYDFSNGFWICSDSVVLFVFHLNTSCNVTKNKRLLLNAEGAFVSYMMARTSYF